MTDVKLEKFLDLMIDQLGGRMGDDSKECPIYQWLNDTLLEVRSENNFNLYVESPIPELKMEKGHCGKCPLK